MKPSVIEATAILTVVDDHVTGQKLAKPDLPTGSEMSVSNGANKTGEGQKPGGVGIDGGGDGGAGAGGAGGGGGDERDKPNAPDEEQFEEDEEEDEENPSSAASG